MSYILGRCDIIRVLIVVDACSGRGRLFEEATIVVEVRRFLRGKLHLLLLMVRSPMKSSKCHTGGEESDFPRGIWMFCVGIGFSL